MAEEQGSCNGVLGAVPLRQPEAEPSSLEVSRPMSSAGSVSKLIEQAVNGDRAAWEAAAQALWERYNPLLLDWIRRWLRARAWNLNHDESAVSLAMTALFLGLRDGKFPRLHDRDDLWRLLVAIAENKIKDLVKGDARHPSGPLPEGEPVAALGAAPDLALALQELLDRLKDPTLRTIAWALLQGHTNEEIAALLGRAVRTVERKRKLIRRILADAYPTKEDAP